MKTYKISISTNSLDSDKVLNDICRFNCIVKPYPPTHFVTGGLKLDDAIISRSMIGGTIRYEVKYTTITN